MRDTSEECSGSTEQPLRVYHICSSGVVMMGGDTNCFLYVDTRHVHSSKHDKRYLFLYHVPDSR